MMKKYFCFSFFFLSLFLGTVSAQEVASTTTKNISRIGDNFDLINGIKMYPNPVGNFLIIDSKIRVTKVQVFSLLGTKVMEIDSNFKSIYLGELKSGIYMIKIHSDNISTTKKLIKK